jgi:lipopolysaccharide transport system permease protein
MRFAERVVIPLATRNAGAIRRYLDLTRALAEREFLSVYRGNLTGALASFVVPLLMLGTYTFVFSVLIPVRMQAGQSRLDYGFFLFSGLIAWNLFADVAARAPRLFVDSPQYVARPQFPISAIVAAPCLAAFYRSLPWLAAFLVARWALSESPPATLWLAPLMLVWTALLTLGVALVLASIGALIRDLADFVPPGLTLLFFLSPILYPQDVLARASEWIGRLNPLAPQITMVRGLVFEGVMPTANDLFAAAAATVLWGIAGCVLYRTTRPVLQDLA